MLRVPWNSCTTFAAIGSALAYAILIPAFGLYWELVPGGIAGLIAVYAVSTATGNWLSSIGIRRLLPQCLITGIGAALITLLAGTCAIAATNLLVQAGIDVADAPGLPLWNATIESLRSNAPEFLVQPIVAGVIYGKWPALLLGIAYGTTLRSVDAVSTPRFAYIRVATGGSVFLLFLAVGPTIFATRDPGTRSHVPDGVPVAISGCGELAIASGVLAFCPASPCEQGMCDWSMTVDAFAVFVEGPPGGRWKSTGGGMGNTSSPHIVRHNINWVEPGADGHFDETNPRRRVGYEVRFDAQGIRIGRHRFEFEPGMLLVIRYADDWSYTVSVGEDALRGTGMTLELLQQRLDAICSMNFGCARRFRIAG